MFLAIDPPLEWNCYSVACACNSLAVSQNLITGFVQFVLSCKHFPILFIRTSLQRNAMYDGRLVYPFSGLSGRRLEQVAIMERLQCIMRSRTDDQAKVVCEADARAWRI